LYLFQIPPNPYTGQRTSHKPQDIESVITIQNKMLKQKNVSPKSQIKIKINISYRNYQYNTERNIAQAQTHNETC
jgi:hypothetical protein